MPAPASPAAAAVRDPADDDPCLRPLINQCLCTDALDLLRSLPDHSIDLIFTDPPWGVTRLELDAGGRPPVAVWQECARVLNPDGWLLCFGTLPLFAEILSSSSPPQAAWQDAWPYIWHKPHGGPNLTVPTRPNMNHELIQAFHLNGPAASRFFDHMAMRTYGHGNYRRPSLTIKPSTYHDDYGVTGGRKPVCESTDGGRWAATVLEGHQPKTHMPKRERTDHPAQKPTSLLRYLIKGHCPVNGIVLDPYAGSGSAAEAARAVGRRYIAGEINPHWHGVAARRLVSLQDYSEAGTPDDDDKAAAAAANAYDASAYTPRD